MINVNTNAVNLNSLSNLKQLRLNLLLFNIVHFKHPKVNIEFKQIKVIQLQFWVCILKTNEFYKQEVLVLESKNF